MIPVSFAPKMKMMQNQFHLTIVRIMWARGPHGLITLTAIKCTEIGEAKEGIERGVVLASFNAG